MKNNNKICVRGLSILIGSMASIFPRPGIAESVLYAIDNLDPLLSVVNPITGAQESVIAITLDGETINNGNGLAVSPISNEMYAAVKLDSQTGPGRNLIKIVPETGVATNIGNMGQPIASLAFDSNGILYAVSGDCLNGCGGAAIAETLFTVNINDASLTLFQTLGNGNDGEAIAFNPDDGMMYHISGKGFGFIFEKINLTNGVVTPIPLSGTSIGNLEAIGFTFDPGQNLFVGSLIDWINCYCEGPFFTVTAIGFMTHVNLLEFPWKDYAFYEATGPSPPFTTVAGLPDINSNGFADIAVIVEAASSHVHIRDGNTGALISDINFGDDPVTAMVVIDDISGNGLPEIALLGTRPDSNVRVQVKDSATGATVNNIFYGTGYSAVDMAVLPDTDSNGADELVVVGADVTGGVRVQARDALSDAATSTTFYGDKVPPMDVLVVPDVSTNGEPEVLMHGLVTASNQGRAQMRDSSTKALLRNMFFGSVYAPLELAVIEDISGDGIPDLAQLGRRDDTGAVRIQVKRSDTGATISNAFTGSVNTPITLLGIGDANGNSASDVALLVELTGGTARIIVRDGATGAFIRNTFVDLVSNPIAMALVPDMNGSGEPELAVLGDDGAGTKRVQIKDSISGAQINTIDFP